MFKDIISKESISSIHIAWARRLVCRTFDSLGLFFAPDPGGSGTLPPLLHPDPLPPSPTRTVLFPPSLYEQPPTCTLGAGPCDGDIASLVLVSGVFVLVTALGSFNRHRQGGFLSVAWVTEFLFCVFPFLSTLPAFDSVITRVLIASFVAVTLASAVPALQGIVQDLLAVVELCQGTFSNAAHLTTPVPSTVHPSQTSNAICSVPALSGIESDVVDVPLNVAQQYQVQGDKEAPSSIHSEDEHSEHIDEVEATFYDAQDEESCTTAVAQVEERSVSALLGAQFADVPYVGSDKGSEPKGEDNEEHRSDAEHRRDVGQPVVPSASFWNVADPLPEVNAEVVVDVHPHASSDEERGDGLEDMRRLRQGIRRAKRKHTDEFEVLQEEQARIAADLARVRKLLQEGLDDARSVLSGIDDATAAANTRTPPVLDEDDDWEAEFIADCARAAQALEEAEGEVEERHSEANIESLELLGPSATSCPHHIAPQDVVTSTPSTNDGTVPPSTYFDDDDDSSWRRKFEKDVALSAQALTEEDERVPVRISEIEAGEITPSHPGVPSGLLRSGPEDLSAPLDPGFLRRVDADDPDVVSDRDHHAAPAAAGSHEERRDTDEPCTEALTHRQEEDDGISGSSVHPESSLPSYGSLQQLHARYESGDWSRLGDVEQPFGTISPSSSQWEDGNAQVDGAINGEDRTRSFTAGPPASFQANARSSENGIGTYGSLDRLHAAYEETQWSRLADVRPPFNLVSPSPSHRDNNDEDMEVDMEFSKTDDRRRTEAYSSPGGLHEHDYHSAHEESDLPCHGSLALLHARLESGEWPGLTSVEPPFAGSSPFTSRQEEEGNSPEVLMDIDHEHYSRPPLVGVPLSIPTVASENISRPSQNTGLAVVTHGSLEPVHTAYEGHHWSRLPDIQPPGDSASSYDEFRVIESESPSTSTSPSSSQWNYEEGDAMEIDVEIQEEELSGSCLPSLLLSIPAVASANTSGSSQVPELAIATHGSLQRLHATYEGREWSRLVDTQPPGDCASSSLSQHDNEDGDDLEFRVIDGEPPFTSTSSSSSHWDYEEGDARDIDVEIEGEDSSAFCLPACPLSALTVAKANIPDSSRMTEAAIATHGSLEPVRAAYREGEWSLLVDVQSLGGSASSLSSQPDDEDGDDPGNEELSRRGMQACSSLEPLHRQHQSSQWQSLLDMTLSFDHLLVSCSS
ncbi:hypothetical protein OE88DRAFT_1734606 [Heliocybe sulcata]|uniref:Uncharacterized protein n=1 Tax=Heliocybe sulcata TaxID=5364 RepID=A0A5C3N9J2_9AGAM|nr:hypothetical protein OE88DRAFT_1734606 [Heliocybe sulcata]